MGFFPLLFFGVVLLFYPLVNAILFKTPLPAELVGGDAAFLGEFVEFLGFKPQIIRDFTDGQKRDGH